jgi:hypothetical protein
MASDAPPIQIFGIRHHGPGSARSLRHALHAMQPEVVLVEGPPEAADVLPLLTHADMHPPVSLLVYVPDALQQAVFYPFALFSPEWQALHYGLSQGIAVRFMDLPQRHQFAIRAAAEAEQATDTEAEQEPDTDKEPAADTPPTEEEADPAPPHPRHDPLGALAEASGYSDGERWWDHMVEQRRDATDLFAAILEAMTALREELPPSDDPMEAPREAFMRKTIREAQRDGFQRIAVVCGAWHAPALAHMPPPKDDNAILKGLPKVKTQATWVPWTYSRLSYSSGYGAGIESPGWYHHLWTTPDHVVEHWLTRVARLLREEDLDASSAHVIEAVRLSEALAALRGRPLPGLPELNEATQSVMCHGSDVPLRLIARKLIVSETMGAVPDETPMVPLQRDLEREQKRLRLKAEATERKLDLDLRKPTDLERSYLLHRLNLIGIPWGETEHTHGKKGTFHELWTLQWQPEFAIKLIEAGGWGNTVFDAATAFARHAASNADDLPALTMLIDRVLLADLPDAIGYLMERLQARAAVTSDMVHLMAALPPLANVLRYGNVRKTDTSMVARVVDGLVVRVCVGVPLACASLNDDAADAMFTHISNFHSAVTLLYNEAHTAAWHNALRHLVALPNIHGLVTGRCCRLLFDAHQLSGDEAARQMGLSLSAASDPHQAAAWLDGFVRGSGLILLHDEQLWRILDTWVAEQSADTFTALLPLLRRTFSTFEAPERRQLGELARHGQRSRADGSATEREIDHQRAERVLPLVARLLGIEEEQP